ncbi:hypothetical protein [Streptomyces celluloflavus]|uniref:hypothetical protein n=1 Tax=Streptomyces celluloflavus TaxID=58344 RepID=UPI00369BE222
MDFSTLLLNMERRPGAYGLNGSYQDFVAFINGCDAIQDWTLLLGFRDWLAERLGRGTNLVWWELVRQIYESEHETSASESTDEIVCGQMFALLREFLARETA